VPLESVSNPVGEVPQEPPAIEILPEPLPGNAGSATGEVSRSAKYLAVKGRLEGLIGGPPSAIESVIGPDERTRIVDTELAPWRRICALRVLSPAGNFIGTGWFAGPRTVITAGHCVFHRQMSGWATRITVIPGRNGTEMPYGEASSTRFSSLNYWTETTNPDYDIGAIHLETSFGDQVGWFSTAVLSDADIPGYLINISGYPGDRGLGNEQYFHANRILRVTNSRVFYSNDTAQGQSGSPVWIYPAADAEPMAIGIHNYGVGGTPADYNITANSATRIVPEVLDQMRAWIETNG